MEEVDITKVGEKISCLRKEQGLTLKEMSEYTGFSIGFLSNLETGKTSPTLESLRLITNVLQTDFLDLLISDKKRKIMIPKDSQTISEYPKYNMNIRRIDFGFNGQIHEIATIEPGDTEKTPFYRHLYTETGIVIEGELVVELDEEVYVLHKYDSIYIPEKSKHRMYNKSADATISCWTHVRK